MTGIELRWCEDGCDYLEPVIENGSLSLGDILHQNQALLLLLHKGELKELPAVGAGISDMLLDHDPIYWRMLIKDQLEMDGQRVKSVVIRHDGILIDSDY